MSGPSYGLNPLECVRKTQHIENTTLLEMTSPGQGGRLMAMSGGGIGVNGYGCETVAVEQDSAAVSDQRFLADGRRVTVSLEQHL
ncbi:MAG: hypothetical protein J07HR59_00067 [Halorubrum sp. J07HR59]|nr:MAG: hypothetical protein J07HR59_00067 [Halorubrum sp. J07HR59]